MKPNLVIMAAGMGSRYGGLKQVDPIGPSGEAIIDYSLYDAKRSGFEKIIFIIREGLESHFDPFLRIEGMDISFVNQDAPSTINPNRTKPWGTGQAVLAAGKNIDGPFSVINADDFYGLAAFEKAFEFLTSSHDHALIGYPLGATLSAHGSVSRAICVEDSGYLDSIKEIAKIWREGKDVVAEENGSRINLSPEQLVSMNFWCFQPEVLKEFEMGFEAFIRSNSESDRAEYLIPDLVQSLLAKGEKVKVEKSSGKWFGITNPDDKMHAQQAILAMIDEGEYPTQLWS